MQFLPVMRPSRVSSEGLETTPELIDDEVGRMRNVKPSRPRHVMAPVCARSIEVTLAFNERRRNGM